LKNIQVLQMGICKGSAIFLQRNAFSFKYDFERWKFLSAPVMHESIVFLRSFVSGNKLLLDELMSKYGENVSVHAMPLSIWQYFSSQIDSC